MQEAELEMLFHKAAKANCDILDQLQNFMLWDLVCEQLPSFSQRASAKAEAFVSPQTCCFVRENELNWIVPAASALTAKEAAILYYSFEVKNVYVEHDEHRTMK